MVAESDMLQLSDKTMQEFSLRVFFKTIKIPNAPCIQA
jgi:hypothetical protein